MNDPERLREAGFDELTTALLEAGRADAPPKSRLERIMSGIAGTGAMLGAHVASASSGTVAAGSLITKSTASFVLVLKWLGLGALAGIVVSAAVASIEPVPRDASAEVNSNLMPARRPVHASASQRKAPVEAQAIITPQLATDSMLARPEDAAHSRRRAADAPPVTASRTKATTLPEQQSVLDAPKSSEPSASAEAQALREEVAALGLAKAALNRGAAGVALEAVHAYRALYAAGRLGPEATYIEMEAELALGNRRRAVEIAEQIAAGTTPNAERAQAILRGR